MKILAIDTATEVCSVALLNGEQLIEKVEAHSPQASRIVLNLLEALLQESGQDWSNIDQLAFGHGPGSFTGVRVATGLIQGLALGHQLPVTGISTLAAVAYQALQHGPRELPVLAVQDARMAEVYWGCYRMNEQGELENISADTISKPAQIHLPAAGQWLAAGNADIHYSAAISATVLSNSLRPQLDWIEGIRPRASAIAALAARRLSRGKTGRLAAEVQPVYLRNQVAQRPRAK